MLISEAFKRFNAVQKNVQWSVSSVNSEGELVVSLWAHYFESGDLNGQRIMKYTDRVSRWNGLGNDEFRRNIAFAYENNVIIRAIIAKTSSPSDVDKGKDASKLKNTFVPKEDWIGRLTQWDSDQFVIIFSQNK